MCNKKCNESKNRAFKKVFHIFFSRQLIITFFKGLRQRKMLLWRYLYIYIVWEIFGPKLDSSEVDPKLKNNLWNYRCLRLSFGKSLPTNTSNFINLIFYLAKIILAFISSVLKLELEFEYTTGESNTSHHTSAILR